MSAPPPAPLPDALVSSPSFMLARVGGEARRRLAEALAREDLRLSDYSAMALLRELESAPQQALSKALNVDRSNVVEIVDRLERCGAAERRPDPDDRRRYAVRLTRRGRAILDRCAAIAAAVDRELLDALGDVERATLLHLLGTVAARYDEHVSLARCVAVADEELVPGA